MMILHNYIKIYKRIKVRKMIFFDVDDTLLDHRYSEYLGIKAFYNKYKHEILSEEEFFYKLWCQVSDKYFQRYLKGDITFSEQQIRRVQEIFNFSGIELSNEEAKKRFDIYLNKYQENWKPFNDVITCLNELTGYRLGIISNGDLKQQFLKLDRLGIRNYFEIIVTAGEIGIAKPSVELFKIACNMINEQPKECYYIGDNLNIDILPCREIGMHGIWLNRNNQQHPITDIIIINSLKSLKSNLF